MKTFLFLIALSWLRFGILAGQSKSDIIAIGILPVTSIPSYGQGYTEYIRDQISNAFASKSRFTVVDRVRLDAVYKERNLQMREDFVDGVIVEQGKSIGAQYLVGGSLRSITYANINTPATDWSTLKSITRLDLQLTIDLNVQIIDVETGAVKSSQKLSCSPLFKGSESTRPLIDNCILPAIEYLGSSIKIWVNDVFPVEIKVVQIEDSDKKGLPTKLLVTGGREMDMQHSSSILSNTSSELEVYEERFVSVDGEQIPRPLVIGRALVEKVEGPFAVCKIKSGQETILQSLNAGKTLYLRIKKY